jgi:hypothetical protein
MRRICSDQNATVVWHLRNILTSAGIDCTMRNEFASGGVGQLSTFDAWPELWVEDRDEYRARMVLKSTFEAADHPDWTCPQCGESIGGAFASCWNCTQDTEEPSEA